MRRARGAPASRLTNSLFVGRRSRRSSRPKSRVRELRSVPPPLLRRSRSNRFGWGSSRRPWGRGVHHHKRFEALVVTAKKQVPCAIAVTRRDVAGHYQPKSVMPSTPGSSDSNVFRRSCSDPARIRQPRLAAQLRGCHPRMASFHLHDARPRPDNRLGDPRELEDGTVGLDPSRACVRTPLFTMFDHGLPPLPMTRPKSLSGAEVVPFPFATMEIRVPSRRRRVRVPAVSR